MSGVEFASEFTLNNQYTLDKNNYLSVGLYVNS